MLTEARRRLADAVARALKADPDFVIIGTQRGGTTSLYEWLAAHPGVAPASKKELHYFDRNYERGIGWYRRHFPYRAGLGGRRTGEATPYLLFHPLAPQRVVETIPNVKLIALLRNPVDRAWSHWHLEHRRGYEDLSFEEAIDREAERLTDAEESIRTGSHESHQRHSYLARGLYAEQVERWQRAFEPDQLLVLESEAMYQNPASVLGPICDHLGIERLDTPFPHANARSDSAVPPALRARLDDYFKEPNARLVSVLGWAPSWCE